MTALHFSRHLPTTSWQLWDRQFFLLLDTEASDLVSERISGPQGPEEAKASLFPGAWQPHPQVLSILLARPQVTESQFPRVGGLWVQRSWDHIWSPTFLKSREPSAPR